MSKGGNVISAVGPRLGFQAKPPERGSFPIDHDGECKDFQKLFMKCLKEAGGDNGKCRIQSMNYLDCRMKKKLMQQETWKNLGYADIAVKET